MFESNKERVKKIMNERHATKTFNIDKPVKQADFDFLMEMARLTPSSIGLEPWKILNIKNQEIREKLFPCSWGAQRGQLKAPCYIAILAGKEGLYSPDCDYVLHMMREIHNFPTELIAPYSAKISQMFDARPAAAKASSFFDYSVAQVHALAYNISYAAAAIGLDTCIIGGFDQDGVERVLSEQHNLYDSHIWGVGLFMAIGYREGPPLREKSRKPMDEFLEVVE